MQFCTGIVIASIGNGIGIGHGVDIDISIGIGIGDWLRYTWG